MLSAGQEIDRYVVEAELGRGGMAVVYRVRHARLGSHHALKILTLTSAGLKERLLQEGQVQATLRHPNVVAVTDVLEVDGQPGLVMEFVEGPTLEDWLESHRPTVEQAERIFRGVLAAVEAAHAKDLVHRDLKPANVLLHPLSGDFIPKVADFGLAKALAEENVGRARTRSGMAMGTPRYMAPEQIRDAGGVDQRADMFSLGCMLYELLTGHPPFDGPDVLSVFNRVASGAYVAPDSLVPDVPPHLSLAVRGCIVVDADRRIPDCRTLRAVLDGEPWDAPAVPAGGVVSQPGASAETWLGDAGPEGASPVSSTAPTVPGAASEGPGAGVQAASNAPASSPKATRSQAGVSLAPRRVGWMAAGGGLVLALGVGAVVVLVGGLVVGRLALGAWHDAHVRDLLATHTDGEVTVGTVGLRWSGLELRDVRVHASDGVEIATIDRVVLQGDSPGYLLGFGELQRIAIHDVQVDVTREDGSWSLPEQTLESLADAPPTDPPELLVGPISLRARADTGTLKASVDEVWFGGDEEQSWRVQALAVAVHLPFLDIASMEGSAGKARVEGLELWLQSRRDGWLDMPPVLSDGVPDWLGGTAKGESETVFARLSDMVPVHVDTVQIEDGAVRLVDTAHATHDVEWAMILSPAGATREGDDWRIAGVGTLDAGRVTVDGTARPDGTFEAHVDLRDLPLTALHPYVGPELANEGVAIDGGMVSGSALIYQDGPNMGWSADARMASPTFVPLSGDPSDLTRRQRRLLGSRELVQAHGEGLGVLVDAQYQPVEDFADAIAEALLAPVGRRVVRPARRVVEPEPDPSTEDEAAPEPEVRSVPRTAPTDPEPAEVPETVKERWERRRDKARDVLDVLRREADRLPKP